MKLDHTFFNVVITFIAVTLVSFLIKGGSVGFESVINMLSATIFNVSIFLAAAFSLQYFQMGTNKNIQEEIFDEKNVAAAIYQGLLFIGLAIIIAKAV